MSLGSRCWWMSCVLWIGLCGCRPLAEAPVDEQKNPHYRAAKDRLSALDYKGAIECFERALEDKPNSFLPHYEREVLYDQHENDYESALYHYNRALNLRRSGYPADNIRQRIPACRQELAKADSLSVINPTVLRETERLREENQELRKQLEAMKAFLANRRTAAVSPSPISTPPGPSPGSSQGFLVAAARTNAPGLRSAGSLSPDRARPAASFPARLSRTHQVKAGETPASIARLYQIKLSSLLA